MKLLMMNKTRNEHLPVVLLALFNLVLVLKATEATMASKTDRDCIQDHINKDRLSLSTSFPVRAASYFSILIEVLKMPSKIGHRCRSGLDL